MKSNNPVILVALALLTTDELRATAKRLDVPVGKSKSNTIVNLADAIQENKVRCSLEFTLRSNDIPGSYAPAVFSTRYRTHKADKVRKSPVVYATLLNGQPA